MNQDRLLERIEILWNSYWQKQSDRLFNHSTDMFMDYIVSIPYCKCVLDKLKKDYPSTDEDIINYNQKEWDTFISQKNNMQILSFLLHWYEKRKSEKKFYFNDCKCLGYSHDTSTYDKMQMFKADVIRPIVDYIIFNLNDERYVLYLLGRYKQRIKCFEKIKSNIKEIGNSEDGNDEDESKGTMTLNESILQKDLCLYLFDNGIDVHLEEEIGNGRLDILINHNNIPFIIEVKYIKGTEKEYSYIDRVRKAVTQVKDYMLSKRAQNGCIFIYTEVDIDFIGIYPDILNVQLHTIYIGPNKPSERNTRNIIVELK